eukprot:1002160-Pelagomonas_calceolata.AAC.5
MHAGVPWTGAAFRIRVATRLAAAIQGVHFPALLVCWPHGWGHHEGPCVLADVACLLEMMRLYTGHRLEDSAMSCVKSTGKCQQPKEVRGQFMHSDSEGVFGCGSTGVRKGEGHFLSPAAKSCKLQ